MSDPYKVLGISRDATDDEVKQAYRKLSRKYHPDANINNPNKDKAEEMFKLVGQAYNQIMDERKNGYGSSGYGGYGSYGNGSGSYGNGGSAYGGSGNGNYGGGYSAILLMICLVVLEASAVLTVSRDNPASITVRMLLITLLHLTILITDTFRKL